MAATATGLLDLEKELVCSICTEVLYQPLTLIDCLHTFCGSCLKEWFAWQYTKATQSQSSPSTSLNPYTCPSCRASVKDARHNAQVSTLLGMFLAAFPGRGKSAEEKEQMAKAYRPGESILPKIEPERRSARRPRRLEVDEAEERRSIEEVRERSMREMGGRSERNNSRLEIPSTAHGNSRSQSRETREREERRERRREHERRERRRRAEAEQAGQLREPAAPSLPPRLTPPPTSPRHPAQVEARQREGQLAHQSSLRSLMSGSESGTGTGDSLNEERILQQILDEGLLEGIDLHDLDPAQQDQLSERIAEAYRQRHHGANRTSPPQASRTTSREAASTSESERVRERQQEAERRHHHRSRSAQGSITTEVRRTANQAESRHPPVSRPHLLPGTENVNQSPTSRERRRRDSDNNRPSSSRSHRVVSREAVGSQASRSTTDLTDTSLIDGPSRRPHVRHAPNTRRTHTEPEQSSTIMETWREGRVENHRAQVAQTPQVDSLTRLSPTTEARSTPVVAAHTAHHQQTLTIPETHTTAGGSQPSTAVPLSSPVGPVLPLSQDNTTYREPEISCARCARPNIQYVSHKHCSKCPMDLCLRCYREKRGCSHWFGFGPTAQANFETSQPRRASRMMEPSHVIVGRKYLRPPQSSDTGGQTNASGGNAAAESPTSDPAARLQEGKFCDRCHAFANACFWSCDYCNEGEWGFCTKCINTHHCCTHPLLPIVHQSCAPGKPNQQPQPNHGTPRGDITFTSSNLHASILQQSNGDDRPSTLDLAQDRSTPESANYLPLNFTANCDFCGTTIPTDLTRFKCPSHPTPTPNDPDSKGDYDVCMNCYFNVVKTGQIKRDDGPAGWRRCPQGHRMIVVGFEEWPEGRRRVIINDLIGGHRMTDEDIVKFNASSNTVSTSSTNPPIAGRWSWKEDPAGTKRSSRVRALGSTHSSKFPPDGGYGKVCVALWSYYPEEGQNGEGELLFPRGAEIKEVEEVNDEWYYGVYMGEKGLLPAQYVRVLEG